jgi:anthranilate/para-aminobenzoate synthase component I
MQLRAEGKAFAALVSAAGRPGLGRRSLLATHLQAVPVLPSRTPEELLKQLRAATTAHFAAGAKGILVLVSHEAAGFFDHFETHPPWRGLPPIQLWAAHEIETYPPAAFDRPEVETVLQGRSSWDAATHGAALQQAQAAIGRGDCYQVCLTYPILTEVPRDPGATFSQWLARQAVDHAAWVFLPEVSRAGTQVGAGTGAVGTGAVGTGAVSTRSEFELLCCSPERFFSLTAGKLIVQPMKGTRPIPQGLSAQESAAVARSLEVAEKDRAENIMIVDLMRNDLGRVCQAGSVHVRELCEVHRYASVAQMTSTVTGQLQAGRDVWDVLAASFPPGSMTGAPKIEACKWIRRLEQGPRGLYGGTVGWLEPNGDAEFNVVIRSLQVFQGEARWDVGGGIVADSTPEGEWLETRAKAALLD